jgi:hypothetical protein
MLMRARTSTSSHVLAGASTDQTREIIKLSIISRWSLYCFWFTHNSGLSTFSSNETDATRKTAFHGRLSWIIRLHGGFATIPSSKLVKIIF